MRIYVYMHMCTRICDINGLWPEYTDMIELRDRHAWMKHPWSGMFTKASVKVVPWDHSSSGYLGKHALANTNRALRWLNMHELAEDYCSLLYICCYCIYIFGITLIFYVQQANVIIVTSKVKAQYSATCEKIRRYVWWCNITPVR